MFTFVDFGSLLPNGVFLDNSLIADSSQTIASASSNNIEIVFNSIAPRSKVINAKNSLINLDTGEVCEGTSVKNLDLFSNEEDSESFLNGQVGVIRFNCSSLDLKEGKELRGIVKIYMEDSRSKLEEISQGDIRLIISK